ncbi:MAG: hypothetical protein RBT76_13760 [candidate division Zixibacteria bacterium]|nr:hypothetical protein [candidate division Zixibacteria bacterium]
MPIDDTTEFMTAEISTGRDRSREERAALLVADDFLKRIRYQIYPPPARKKLYLIYCGTTSYDGFERSVFQQISSPV